MQCLYWIKETIVIFAKNIAGILEFNSIFVNLLSYTIFTMSWRSKNFPDDMIWIVRYLIKWMLPV